MLICLAGSLTATVTTFKDDAIVHRMSTGTSVYLPPLNWLGLTDFTPDAVLGVIASEPYDSREYITSKHELSALWHSTHND
jgi:hypothetical protein